MICKILHHIHLSMAYVICACLPLPVGAASLSVGNVSVAVIDDCPNVFSDEIFKGLARESEIASLMPSGKFEAVVRTYLARSADRVVLFDAGWGPEGKRKGRTLEALAELGVKPEGVTDILMTHLDVDHVSGLVAGGKAIYPNATLHIAEAEYDAWIVQGTARPAPAIENACKAVAAYAGRVSRHAYGKEPVPGIMAVAAQGHTPGHTAYFISSGKDRLCIVGDLLHVAPVQLRNPDQNSHYDAAPQAAQTRRELLSRLAREKCLVAGMHFVDIGFVREKDGGFAIEP